MTQRVTTRRTVQLHVDQLVPGMELSQDLVSGDGAVLAGAGTIVSSHTINKLRNWQITTVNIVSEASVNPIISREVEQFVNSYNKSVSVVQRAFSTLRDNQEVPLEAFTATADELASGVQAAGNVVDRLYDLPPCDDATFQHSVNVGVIAALIATWMNYPPEVVNAVSLAGLLHDVGKSQLPQAILHRTNLLPPNDYDHYKQHVRYGFELVKSLDLADSVKAGIAQHHERNDRSGYPLSLPGEKIHPYAKIVAVADIYDEALTINREPSTVYSPYSGLEMINDAKHRADPEICLLFSGRMLNFLSGNIVALNDGREARVVYLNSVSPSRSIVQLTSGAVLDLADDPELRIHHVIR
ncbi:HD-GYP domain-containing protein [Anaeroselena agilis]|uniref:HD domain-containing protein n=1 Tax=Anaeroselena agilis TaxID=3063788 RepID=A0ABU3NUI5_9FIRM|nr:HD domain-containing protein [Selenomonadales bacterium 4137-cl]